MAPRKRKEQNALVFLALELGRHPAGIVVAGLVIGAVVAAILLR